MLVEGLSRCVVLVLYQRGTAAAASSGPEKENMLGIFPIEEARVMAEQMELDLVLINLTEFKIFISNEPFGPLSLSNLFSK